MISYSHELQGTMKKTVCCDDDESEALSFFPGGEAAMQLWDRTLVMIVTIMKKARVILEPLFAGQVRLKTRGTSVGTIRNNSREGLGNKSLTLSK